jgi:hypothetical protein
MAKKKRRPRNRPTANRAPSQTATETESPQPRGGTTTTRRAHKEEARKAREAARKRQLRASAARRILVISVITLVAVGVLWFLQRAANPRPISAEAVAAAQKAGCTGVVEPSSDPVGGHLNPGETITYPDKPATSGRHDPTPLPTSPDVYTAPVPETQAVHFLEHSGVILYYRQTGPDALKQDVVDALAQVARDQHNTLLAPYPDLPEGTSLALTAWNHLQTCPGTITAAEAGTVANGFANAFVCTSVGPEPKASPDC